MRPITTKMHGMVDLLTAATLPALPRMLGWSDRVTRLFDVLAIGSLGYSIFTRYEFGLVKVLPMKDHLKFDAMGGGTLLAAAALMDDEDPEVREVLAGLGLFFLTNAFLTQTVPGPSAYGYSSEELVEVEPLEMTDSPVRAGALI